MPGASFADVARSMGYMLKRGDSFSRFLTDGRVYLAAQRNVRFVVSPWDGRPSFLPDQIAGSDRGGERAAAMYSLIATAGLNDVDPRVWLADVLRRKATGTAALEPEPGKQAISAA